MIDRFESLLKLVERTDLPALWEALEALPDLSPAEAKEEELLAA